MPETPPCRTAPASPFELPAFSPAMISTFIWGSHDSVAFMNSLSAVYSEVVHWRPNLFKVPFGKSGKSFVSELARMYKAFASSSGIDCHEGSSCSAYFVVTEAFLEVKSQRTQCMLGQTVENMALWGLE